MSFVVAKSVSRSYPMRVIRLIFFWLMLLAPCTASAALIHGDGTGQATYRSQSKRDAREQAVHKAKMNALTSYVSSFGLPKSAAFDRIRPVVELEIDRFVPDFVLREEVQDKEHETFRVVLDATIDATAIEKELSQVQGVAASSRQEKSFISFVFVAREAKSVRKFETRRTVQRMAEVTDEETEDSLAGNGALGYSSSRSISAKASAGGSSLKKADEIFWNVSTVNEIDVAMNNIFTTAGYEVIDAVDVYAASKGMLDSDSFKRDYKSGDDISATTRRNAIAGCKIAELDYFATGTLDIGMNDTDPDTGLERVFVSVTGKIWSLAAKFPKIVASVGPVQYAGVGPDQRVAKLNALKLAGEEAARELTSQLQMKGIQ